MRQLFSLALLVVAAACNLSRGGPEQTIISVKVVDDNGAPVVRTAVLVSGSLSPLVHTRTGDDGSVEVRLEVGGTYRVQALPKNGYIDNDGLARDVTVATNERAAVTFRMARGGDIGDPREPQTSSP
jgi:hypothetical protein